MAYKGPPRFVYLELRDEDVNCVLQGLRHEFGGKDHGSDMHVTIRGPYHSEIGRDQLDHYQDVLKRDPITLDGFGIFNNDDESVVYMKVESPRIREVWWKPDYPIKKYGFNPHVSLYKGSDRRLAERILEFLEVQDLKFLLRSFRVTQYASRQSELFPLDRLPQTDHFMSLANRGFIEPGLLRRAANVAKTCGGLA